MRIAGIAESAEKKNRPRVSHVLAILCVFASLVPTALLSTPASTVTAFPRDGQIFITWDQITDQGYEYRIYRSLAPIAEPSDLASAQLLATLWDSTALNERASFWTDSLYTFVITEGEPPLPLTKGLFVYTAKEDVTAYYAVTAVVEGVEDSTIDAGPGGNTTPDGVPETVSVPQPVLQRTGSDTLLAYRDYVFWTDDVGIGGFPAMSSLPGVPVNFRVTNDLGDSVSQPLMVWLHGGNRDFKAPSRSGGDGVLILKVDDPKYAHPYPAKHNDYWFGFNSNYGRGAPLDEGLNMNYVERRLLYCISWTLENFSVDEERIFLVGNSMGACGTVSFGLRHPEIFSAVLAMKPKLDFSDPLWWGHVHLDDQWGTLEQNIPTDEGTGIYDRMNAILYVEENAADDFPVVFCFFGKFDEDVGWAEKVVFMDRFQEMRQMGYFYWDESVHGPLGSWLGEMEYRYDLLQSYRRTESYPALTNLSTNDDPGDGDPAVGDTVGTIGAYAAWDRSSIVDTRILYEVTIMLDDTDPHLELPADSASVDVTPRRLQEFAIEEGRRYLWSNTDLAAGTVIQQGTVRGDASGHVTIEGFSVKTTGNRLSLTRAHPVVWREPHRF